MELILNSLRGEYIYVVWIKTVFQGKFYVAVPCYVASDKYTGIDSLDCHGTDIKQS